MKGAIWEVKISMLNQKNLRLNLIFILFSITVINAIFDLNNDKKSIDLINFRWLIEELRVSLFAQELKTPFPISIKRLEKTWQEIHH